MAEIVITMKILRLLCVVLGLGCLTLGCSVGKNSIHCPLNFSSDNLTRFLDETTGIEFVLVPAGNFFMGSPDNGMDRESDEGPMQEVSIDSFFMSVTEVTQGQWEKIMGSNPSKLQFGGSYPVENVSFNEVHRFLKRAFKKSQFSYRLPTEAEWEYACRAGSTTPYFCCPDEKTLLEYAWFGSNSGGETHPVKTLFPNKWGLYDMHGNVNEWVADGRRGYLRVPVSNPVGPMGSDKVMARGGCWLYPAYMCRSARRLQFEKDFQSYVLGFRVVLDTAAVAQCFDILKKGKP
jgi:formylglycine-generating enzyme required for sulfatase activity